MRTEIETHFKVRFSSAGGATIAEAGITRTYNQSLLQEDCHHSIVLDNNTVQGLTNIRRLRDLCDRFLEFNLPTQVEAGEVVYTGAGPG